MMTTTDILRLVRRWWWILLILPILFGSIAYGISLQMSEVYRARTTIMIEENRTAGASQYSDILADERRTETFSRLIEARPVLQEAAAQAGIPLTPTQLRQKVNVAPVRNTQLLTISVSDMSPARASTLANAIAEVFISQRTAMAVETSGTELDAVRGQIVTLRDRIAESALQVDELLARPDANSASIETAVSDLRATISQLETQRDVLLEEETRLAIGNIDSGSSLSIVEMSSPPANPVSPRITLNTIIGAIIGVVVAAGVVMFLGYLDDTVKTSEDIERLTESTAVGAIPALRSKEGLEPIQFPRSPASEAYRALRTNLQFASLGRNLKSLVVTSPRPGDGKTTTISNLATVLAQGGQRVILVDADLRKPRLHKVFAGLTNRTGLTNLLLADVHVDLNPLLQLTEVPNLRVLTTGPLPPNPADVLNSKRMKDVIEQLEAAADVILIDAPPMAVSDALIIASLVDGVMLVTSGGRTRSAELVSVVDALGRSGTKLTGVLINRVKLQGESYYYYQSYYTSDADPPTGAGGNGTQVSGNGRDKRRLPTAFGRKSS